MKVLHAIPGLSANSGGPSRSIPALVQSLRARGSELALLRHYYSEEVSIPEGVEGALLEGMTIRTEKENAIPLAAYLKRFDVVHSHGLWTPFNHHISAPNPKVLIVAPRGTLEPWALRHKWLKKRIAWYLYQKRDLQKATAFHATSVSEAENIRRLGFKEPIAVIPNGIVLPDGAESVEQGAGSEEHLHAPRPTPRKRTALFLGRLHPIKNLPSLLTAWSQLNSSDWCLRIVGVDENGHLQELKKQVSSLGLQDQVSFSPPVEGAAKAALFRAADLFVLPSYSENFGIVVAEALSYGIPVLTTTGCPWQELQTHNCGWWVEPTPIGIKGGLNEALRTKNKELSAMGRRGRRLVEENYQWPAIGEKFRVFYRWILEGGERPDFVV